MAIVVSDTSPLRALAHLNLLDLLHVLFDEVFIPPAVELELSQPIPRFLPIDPSVHAFIHVVAPSPASLIKIPTFKKLDAGEIESIALALDRQADFVCMDEKKGRLVALNLGLTPLGVVGILTRTKEKGLITAVAPCLRRLRLELGFFLDSRFETQILRFVGELPF